MTDFEKACCVFVIGLAAIMAFGDACLKVDRRPASPAPSAVGVHPQAPREEEARAERSAPLESSAEPAKACGGYDPVAHPEQVLDILERASAASCGWAASIHEDVCTPVDVIYAIWRNETGEVAGEGRASGKCSVMPQLEIRCRVGGACKHERAMIDMSGRFGWNLDRMTCSCGTATLDTNTHYFGGSCGPFQFSGAEIVDKALSLDLDPMTFCGGAVIAALELREHYIRFRKQGYGVTDAWRWAISRYFGADSRGKYWAHAWTNWDRFHGWYGLGRDSLRAKLAAQASHSAKRHRKLRTLRNALASD